MKRSEVSLAFILFFAIAVTQAAPGNAQNQKNQDANRHIFTGIVMDSGCAAMGSHAQMETQHGMKASKELTGDEAKKCADTCVEAGAKYVLYDSSKKTTYQLSDQATAKRFAGQAVRVTGNYDPSSKTIEVKSILE
jgi:hypothetical protein